MVYFCGADLAVVHKYCYYLCHPLRAREMKSTSSQMDYCLGSCCQLAGAAALMVIRVVRAALQMWAYLIVQLGSVRSWFYRMNG